MPILAQGLDALVFVFLGSGLICVSATAMALFILADLGLTLNRWAFLITSMLTLTVWLLGIGITRRLSIDIDLVREILVDTATINLSAWWFYLTPVLVGSGVIVRSIRAFIPENGYCHQCGYNLYGLWPGSEACPEGGAVLKKDEVVGRDFSRDERNRNA